MINFVPVNREQHSHSAYRSTTNYKFASEMSILPVLNDEVGFVIANMCLAFRKISLGAKETFELVALQSLLPKKNLFLLPDGRWIRGYRPAFYRAYPFALLPTKQLPTAQSADTKGEYQSNGDNPVKSPNKLVLSIDEEALNQNPDKGDLPFFDDQGELSQKLKDTVEFLGKSLKSKQATLETAQLLASYDLITPWPIRFTLPDDKQQKKTATIEGLFRINEEKLLELPGNSLVKLSSAGALKVAHAQLLSACRLKELAERETAFRQVEQKLQGKHKPEEELELDDLFGNNDDLLTF